MNIELGLMMHLAFICTARGMEWMARQAVPRAQARPLTIMKRNADSDSESEVSLGRDLTLGSRPDPTQLMRIYYTLFLGVHSLQVTWAARSCSQICRV